MPDSLIIAIPDIHGEAERLERLLKLIRHHWPAVKLVFLGNYINYGPDSAGVLRLVRELTEQGHVALRGHAETELLDYLDDPDENRFAWNRYMHWGGCQTMRSLEREAREWFDTPQMLEDYLTKTGMLAWIESLPVFYRENNLVFTPAPVSSTEWNRRGRPNELETVRGSVPGSGEEEYAASLGAPPDCFAVCGHERVVARRYREGVCAPVPDINTPVIAFATDKGDVLRAGEATHWPKHSGNFGPMLFSHGLYLDC
ncbi:MAG: metallophosphoesterase, partial [Planctomycetales bacterium]|nr:metallophosphoesterase [Planctomycetales bacterium]